MQAIKSGAAEFLSDLIKFPFMPDGAERIALLNVKLSDFSDPKYAPVLKAAESKIRMQIGGQYNAGDLDSLTTDDAILTFLCCAVILHLTGDRIAAKKFAMQEARRAEAIIGEMMSQLGKAHRLTILQELYGKALNMPVTEDEKMPFITVKIRVPHYMELYAKMNMMPQYRAAVQEGVQYGWVRIKMFRALRLARESIAFSISRRIFAMNLIGQDIAHPMREVVHSIVTDLEEQRRLTLGKTLLMPKSEEEMPPCVQHCINKLRKGENLGDAGRFFLASYLLACGMEVDKIVEYYRNAPDFNERITRQRLTHTATRGAATGNHFEDGSTHYSVMNCEKLHGHHLCFRSPSCGTIHNPMAYMRQREYP